MNALSPALAVAASTAPLWSAPDADPDAQLIGLHDELLSAGAAVARISYDYEIGDGELDAIVGRLNIACDTILESAPARTQAGLALKAAAAMQQFRFCYGEANFTWSGKIEEQVWNFLSELAGDAYVPLVQDKSEPPRRTVPDVGLDLLDRSHPDAYLIGLCDRWIAVEMQRRAIFDGSDAIADDDDADAAAAPLHAEQERLLQAMEEPRATTATGILARARVVEVKNGAFVLSFDERDSDAGRLLALLMRDAAALAGGEGRPAVAAVPDADLITVCDEFCTLQSTYDTFLHPDGGDAPQAEFDRFYAEEDRLTGRMGELPCATVAGVQAMGRALAAWDKQLLTDAPAKDLGDFIASHMVDRLLALPSDARPNADPDAKLLALRPEFERLRDACIAADDGVDPDLRSDEDVGLPFDMLCKRIAMLPPAVTAAGRALKAIAALHQLTYVDAHNDGPNGALHTCWTMLAADVAGHYPLPKEAA